MIKHLLRQVETSSGYDLMAGLIDALQVYAEDSRNAPQKPAGQMVTDAWIAGIAHVVCRVRRMRYLDSRSQGLIVCAWLHGLTSALYEDQSFDALQFVGNYLEDLKGCTERSSRMLQRACRVLYASGRRDGSGGRLMEVRH